MATKDDIKAFLVTDIPSVVTALSSGPMTAYSGQVEFPNDNVNRTRIEYVRPSPVRRDTGQTRHLLLLRLRGRDWDEDQEDNIAAELARAADEIILAYDGKVSVFNAGLPAVQVERVRVFRPDGQTITGRRQRDIVVNFELDEMED